MAGLVACGDESIRSRWFWLAVALVPTQRLPELGRVVRSLCLAGQRQLHFKDERDSRRRKIISALVDCQLVSCWIYRAPRPVVRARGSCLQSLVNDLVGADVGQLILDRVDAEQAARDRAMLREALRKQGAEVEYRHAAPWECIGIQVADVAAWAYGAGGDWRRRIAPIVDKVTSIDA